MKLVKLLAKELETWAITTVCYVQDPCGSVWPCKIKPNFDGCEWIGDEVIDQNYDAPYLTVSLSSDYASAVVTKSMWQAERDRQKGVEWKRHRAGRKQPVEGGVFVEYKLRGGVTGACPASRLAWSHMGDDTDVMQYRAISQPQAEEVEVKDTTIGTLSYKVEIDTSAATQAIDDLAAKWDQIETPFKWRDEVTELNAYIEKYTREREALIERLASEGFALIPAMTAVMGVADVDFSDWRNWRAGDIVECITNEYAGTYTEGREYKIEWVKEGVFSVYDNYGEPSSCDWFDHDAEGLKFVRRP